MIKGVHTLFYTSEPAAMRAFIRDTDLSLERIAARCGFRHVEYMSVVFKRELGCTPSQYRQSVA